MKKYLIVLLLGLICSLGQPPHHLFIPSLLAISLYLYIQDQALNKIQAFNYGYFFGYGYFVYSHNWFSASLFTYGDQLMWLYPIGVILIPAFFALYFAIAGFCIYRFAKGNIFLTSLIWVLMELIRSYGYIELPWLLIGYIWSDNYLLSQSVSLFGIYGLSFLTIFWAGALKDVYVNKKLRIFYLAIISFFMCLIYGYFHLYEPQNSQNIRIALVQPNIDQNIEARINNRYENLIKVINLSSKNVDYVIWPEGANEFQINEPLLDLLRKAVPENGYLIFNGNRIEQNPLQIWNSMIIIDNSGKIVDFYDKIHLVPLGEYIPLRQFLPFINKITPGNLDFSSGKILAQSTVKDSFLPSICYEASFSDFPTGRYTWTVNITNDGWFGDSIGPSQHLSIARFRSIELGIPMARAALTGISAVIDSFGNIVSYLPLGTEGVIETELPGYLKNYTYFRKYGFNTLNILVLAFFVIFSLLCFLSKTKQSN